VSDISREPFALSIRARKISAHAVKALTQAPNFIFRSYNHLLSQRPLCHLLRSFCQPLNRFEDACSQQNSYHDRSQDACPCRDRNCQVYLVHKQLFGPGQFQAFLID